MDEKRNATALPSNARPYEGNVGALPSDARPYGRMTDAGLFWKLRQAVDRPDTVQLYIYGDVEGNSFDFWTGEAIESDTSAEHFRQELAKYPGAKEIDIYINSYGGEVFEGTAIYNQLRRHPAHKTVYVDGFACSIASVIAMAGDEVVMPRNTLMMIHNMWMGAVGNAAALRKAADDLDTINAAGRQAYLQKAGDKLSEEKLIEMMDNEKWLTAQECVDLGLADRLADEDADMSKAAAIMQRVNMSLEQQVQRNQALSASLRELSVDAGARERGNAAEQCSALRADDGRGPSRPPAPTRDAEARGEPVNEPSLMERLAAML